MKKKFMALSMLVFASSSYYVMPSGGKVPTTAQTSAQKSKSEQGPASKKAQQPKSEQGQLYNLSNKQLQNLLSALPPAPQNTTAPKKKFNVSNSTKEVGAAGQPVSSREGLDLTSANTTEIKQAKQVKTQPTQEQIDAGRANQAAKKIKKQNAKDKAEKANLSPEEYRAKRKKDFNNGQIEEGAAGQPVSSGGSLDMRAPVDQATLQRQKTVRDLQQKESTKVITDEAAEPKRDQGENLVSDDNNRVALIPGKGVVDLPIALNPREANLQSVREGTTTSANPTATGAKPVKPTPPPKPPKPEKTEKSTPDAQAPTDTTATSGLTIAKPAATQTAVSGGWLRQQTSAVSNSVTNLTNKVSQSATHAMNQVSQSATTLRNKLSGKSTATGTEANKQPKPGTTELEAATVNPLLEKSTSGTGAQGPTAQPQPKQTTPKTEKKAERYQGENLASDANNQVALIPGQEVVDLSRPLTPIEKRNLQSVREGRALRNQVSQSATNLTTSANPAEATQAKPVKPPKPQKTEKSTPDAQAPTDTTTTLSPKPTPPPKPRKPAKKDDPNIAKKKAEPEADEGAAIRKLVDESYELVAEGKTVLVALGKLAGATGDTQKMVIPTPEQKAALEKRYMELKSKFINNKAQLDAITAKAEAAYQKDVQAAYKKDPQAFAAANAALQEQLSMPQKVQPKATVTTTPQTTFKDLPPRAFEW